MVAGVALAGCDTSETSEEDVGQVELTIVAVDGQGNTWKLPPGTSLYVSRGNFQDNLPLDGDTQAQTFSLPVGQYEWSLSNMGVAGPEWPLERTDPQNNVETVWATLLTPQPGEFMIMPNQDTSLTLSFQAAVGGSVTFAKGSVQVDAQVDSVEEVGGTFTWSQTVQTNGVNVGPGTSAELVSRLPSVGAQTDVTVVGHIAGTWEMTSSDRVCAPVQIDAVGCPLEGVLDLLVESTQDQPLQRLCLWTWGTVTIDMLSIHEPGTDTFNDQGSESMSFGTSLGATLPTPAFDGTTLDVSVLAGSYTLDGNFLQYADDLTNGGSWSSAANGQVTFSFAPAP